MATLLGPLFRTWERLFRPFLATLAALVLQFGTLGCVHLPSFAEGLFADAKGGEEEGQAEVQPAVESAPPPPVLPMEPQEAPPAKGKRWEWSGDKRQITHIWIDTDTQKARFYDGPEQVGWSYVASGVKKFPTPTGKFAVIGKEKTKESNLYGKIYDAEGKVVVSDAKRGRHKIPPGGRFAGAKMPYFLRLTYDGVGLHAGPIPRPGHPASHGCIRLPAPLAERLFTQVAPGTQVTITGSGPDYGDYQAKLAAQGPARQEPAEGGFAQSSEVVQTYPAKLALSQPPAVKPASGVGATASDPAKPAAAASEPSPHLPSGPQVQPPPVKKRETNIGSAPEPGPGNTPALATAPVTTPAPLTVPVTISASIAKPAPVTIPAPVTTPAPVTIPAPVTKPASAPATSRAPIPPATSAAPAPVRPSAPASAAAPAVANAAPAAQVPVPSTAPPSVVVPADSDARASARVPVDSSAPATAPVPANANASAATPTPPQTNAPATALATGHASASVSTRPLASNSAPAPAPAPAPASAPGPGPGPMATTQDQGHQREASAVNLAASPQAIKPAMGGSLVREGRLEVPVPFTQRPPAVE